MKRVAFTVLYSTILCTENASPATDSIRILILDGQRAGAYHNWQLTKQVLKKELEDTGRFKLRWRPPRSGGDFSNFAPDFSKYQAVVFNYDGPDRRTSLRQQFEQ